MLLVTLYNARQNQTIQHEDGPLEIGRGPQRDVARLVVEDRYVSRDQLRIEERSGGRLFIQNLGSPIAISECGSLERGQSCEVSLPVRITLGFTTLDVALPDGAIFEETPSQLQTIAAPLRPKAAVAESRRLADLGESPPAETLAHWFERLLAVQRAVAGSGEFYVETARAVVDLVGLDRGIVLLRKDGHWRIEASHPPVDDKSRPVSNRVLRQVMEQRRTFFESLGENAIGASLQGVESVVASPIFDEHDNIVGVVYGTRDFRAARAGRAGIQPLEAQVVQLLAAAVSAGLTRLQRESEAARTRIQFEEFFSPELARALERDPSLLEGQEREVTVLFSDLRGFSGLSEIVGARQTYALLGDVMDRLTMRIMEQHGVVIDYYGDGLAAMWNAPTDQPDHAVLACEAALAMQEELPALNERWQAQLGKPVRLGVGINTGPAQVGNAGSRRRLKYGPRGHTVNLASRIEGATKLLGVACLISSFTEQQLPPEVPRRRLCMARLSGVTEPVALYELPGRDPPETWHQLRSLYEDALACFEEGRFAECLRYCAELAGGVGKGDTPTNILAQKASAQLATGGAGFEPVYQLNTKE